MFAFALLGVGCSKPPAINGHWSCVFQFKNRGITGSGNEFITFVEDGDQVQGTATGTGKDHAFTGTYQGKRDGDTYELTQNSSDGDLWASLKLGSQGRLLAGDYGELNKGTKAKPIGTMTCTR